jgi:enterochelin esterase-like enzyme
MRVRNASRIVTRVFTLLVMSTSLAANVPVFATSVDEEKSGTRIDEPTSPRLLALRDRLTSGDRTALDKFWSEINKQGAPLIEPAADSDHDILVTMLWRATGETKNVFVFRLGDVSKPMARLLDTDLWYKTFRLQKGARFIYQFATNLPDPKEWGGIIRFAGDMRNDPLNPFQFADRVNELNPYEVSFTSAVELPSAEPQTWNVARPTVPKGQVRRDKFTSKLLGNERPIWIYTPHGYAAGKKPYPLLVLTDGGGYVNTARVTTILDNLIAAGLIPPLVAVMVENPARWRELSCSSAYADFLAQEIVPWARANYRATDRPEQTIIGGASLGGLQAAFVGLKHSEVFGNVLSQSGSFQWTPEGEKEPEWLTRQFAASPHLPLRFSFEAGLMEGTWWWRSLVPVPANGPPLVDPTTLAANINLRDTLQSKGYVVHYTEFNGNHGMLNWRGTLASHLIALVGIKPAPKISASNKDAVTPSALTRKAIATMNVPPALLQQYSGRYEMDPKFAHDFVLDVSVKDGSLWVKPSSLSLRQLMPVSESRFYDSEIPDLRLDFIRDDKGTITGLTLNTSEADMLLRKMSSEVPSTGNSVSGQTAAQETAEQEVLRTEREQRDAYLQRDIAKTERLVADEFIFTNGRDLGNKKTLIGFMRSSELDPTLTLTSEDTRVTINGDTAIVTGRRVERRRREDNNREGVAYARYMRTYIKRQEHWQLLAEDLQTIPAERTAVKIDTKVFDDYVGQYESAIFDFKVVKDGERLMAVPNERTTTRTSDGRPPAELFPESDAEFFLKGRDAQVIFIRNRKGEVTHAIMRINGADIRAMRVK